MCNRYDCVMCHKARITKRKTCVIFVMCVLPLREGASCSQVPLIVMNERPENWQRKEPELNWEGQ